MADANPNVVRSESYPEPTDANLLPEDRVTDSHGEATLKPQAHAGDLKRWWKPAMPEGLYYMYKVEVVRFEGKGESLKLVFNLAGENTGNVMKNLSVFLYLEPHMVWPEIPSTAPLAQKGQFAYLLLSPEFMEKRAKVSDPRAYAEPGGKWPIGAADFAATGGASRTRVLKAVASLLDALAEMPDGQT